MEQNNVQNFLIRDSQDLNFKINKFEKHIINVFVVSDKDLELNIKLVSKQSSWVEINISGIFFKKQNSKINVFTKAIENYSETYINSFTVLNGESTLNVSLNSDVVNKTLQNKVYQKINGILLDQKSRMTGQPNLKIDTDDIIAMHALNIGSLNKEELFYLMTKKISYTEAKNIILWSKLTHHLKYLDETTQNYYEELLKQGLNY